MTVKACIVRSTCQMLHERLLHLISTVIFSFVIACIALLERVGNMICFILKSTKWRHRKLSVLLYCHHSNLSFFIFVSNLYKWLLKVYIFKVLNLISFRSPQWHWMSLSLSLRFLLHWPWATTNLLPVTSMDWPDSYSEVAC